MRKVVRPALLGKYFKPNEQAPVTEQNCLRYLWNESCYKCDFVYEEKIILTLRTLQKEFEGILLSEASIQTKIEKTANRWFDGVASIGPDEPYSSHYSLSMTVSLKLRRRESIVIAKTREEM